jgi:hypothetical protein
VAVTLGTENVDILFHENCWVWTKAGERLPDKIWICVMLVKHDMIFAVSTADVL